MLMYLVKLARVHLGAVMLAVLGMGRCCRRLVGLRSSAPATVLFNILFIWGVYIALIQPGAMPVLIYCSVIHFFYVHF